MEMNRMSFRLTTEQIRFNEKFRKFNQGEREVQIICLICLYIIKLDIIKVHETASRQPSFFPLITPPPRRCLFQIYYEK